MNYRFDKRTAAEFKKDIKKAHKLEAEIAVRMCIGEYLKTKNWPTLEPNGCDFTGKFIKTNGPVSSAADFKIDGKLVEITRSNYVCDNYFHEKVPKVEKCIKDDTGLVFVNGILDEDEPNFIVLYSKDLKKYTDKAIEKYSKVLHPGTGNKSGFRYDVAWFKNLWRPLPKLLKTGLPKEYTKILNLET